MASNGRHNPSWRRQAQRRGFCNEPHLQKKVKKTLVLHLFLPCCCMCAAPFAYACRSLRWIRSPPLGFAPWPLDLRPHQWIRAAAASRPAAAVGTTRHAEIAMTMKRMLETSFPGIHVILHNYPPPFPKRVLGKVAPILQVGAIATMMAGDQIFPSCTTMSFLQSSGAFEVYCNGDLVFSKLVEQRFPSEFELQDLIGSC
ncbi:hypothetical protein GUJ93_ZPchr0005g14287 [Zizania palustris]|uniref:Uncharacterized protein n=1 Tax=Zizania palustris TaxID=103762 RepID=A0A8J5S4K1_ZIZPA|nr:hypothetical protein GUJ93_ZPchr0005g14287 [Zizania palustris]